MDQQSWRRRDVVDLNLMEHRQRRKQILRKEEDRQQRRKLKNPQSLLTMNKHRQRNEVEADRKAPRKRLHHPKLRVDRETHEAVVDRARKHLRRRTLPPRMRNRMMMMMRRALTSKLRSFVYTQHSHFSVI